MIKQVKLLEAQLKKALDGFANEIKYNKDFIELEVYSKTILESTKAIVDIYLYTDQYPPQDNDPRKEKLFKERVVEISKSLTKANEAVTSLNLVGYVEAVKKMEHQVSHLISLTEKYIELGSLPEKKEKPKVVNKRYKIDEKFDEWKSWVKEYRKDLAYYEPITPYVEDSERQTRLANLVQKLKKANKEKKHG